MVNCPYCQEDLISLVSPGDCRRCFGTKKMPLSLARILARLRTNQVQHLGTSK
jgi:hypothetical protein